MFIFGANLPEGYLVKRALPRIFGVGEFKADKICSQLGLHPRCRVQDMSENQLKRLGELIESDPDKCGHELQRKIAQRVLHLHNIKCWKGDRLARGLPANGQISHNVKTSKKRCGLFVKIFPHGQTQKN